MEKAGECGGTQSRQKHIAWLIKEDGRITDCQFSENSFVEKKQSVEMVERGEITDVGIVHC